MTSECCNDIVLEGKVLTAPALSHENHGVRFFRFFLEVPRLSGQTDTLPLLIPSIRINVVTNIIGSLSVFDIVMSLTGGGPGYQTETLSIYIMRMCYGSKTGYSTAVAIVMFVIVLVPVLISLRLMKRKD